STQHVDYYRELVAAIAAKSEHSELDIAAAIAYLLHKDKELSTQEYAEVRFENQNERGSNKKTGNFKRREFSDRGHTRDRKNDRGNPGKHRHEDRKSRPPRNKKRK
ncbi:MAG TPA: hypothetical protein VI522_03525, partial [Gammaproteobacteria bacterium]|nr:hypothetical protein [Gammaproteobacteria bacterium]